MGLLGSSASPAARRDRVLAPVHTDCNHMSRATLYSSDNAEFLEESLVGSSRPTSPGSVDLVRASTRASAAHIVRFSPQMRTALLSARAKKNDAAAATRTTDGDSFTVGSGEDQLVPVPPEVYQLTLYLLRGPFRDTPWGAKVWILAYSLNVLACGYFIGETIAGMDPNLKTGGIAIGAGISWPAFVFGPCLYFTLWPYLRPMPSHGHSGDQS